MVEIKTLTPEPLFPTYVWVVDLEPEVYEPMNQRMLRDLNELTRPRPKMPPGRNWQTQQNLHHFEEFKELAEIFMAASAKVFEIFAFEHGDFVITGCWANINPKNTFHMPHTHPNNFLSGIYYLQAESGADSVSFHDPRPHNHIMSPMVKQENAYNSIIQNVRVKAGRLLLFPAWFVHSVSMNQSDQLRISISFNIMFSAFAETMSQPKWEGIPLKRR